jgi:hypothetical protein
MATYMHGYYSPVRLLYSQDFDVERGYLRIAFSHRGTVSYTSHVDAEMSLRFKI